MTWASVADVDTLLGETVTAPTMAKANMDVTVYCNRMPSASAGMGQRDLYWLQLAAAYQAVWRTGQVDIDTRQSVKSLSTDGESVDYGDGEWKVVLAPMAARSLRNLSWKGTRTERPDPLTARAAFEFLEETVDDEHGWQPLEMGR
jgi:hypothetical protein